ncbi:radical SAM family heme chaperone HemW [Puteibacter caeruleilacunae]|nr:radical SAM family heme chaperone HemW [Puteibacter caeruleilacunae]
MAGIYLHIPFCKSKCHYCDFHKSTSLYDKSLIIKTLKTELTKRVDYIKGEVVNTIYLGGGTPSLLSIEELTDILNHIGGLFEISRDAEVTLEANPDDLTKAYCRELRSIGFNRLSIGIQSFQQDDLAIMNRRHSAEQARQAVQIAQQEGFSNISIDLIYGLPNMTTERWKMNLEEAFKLNIQHISAYHLTYHQGTLFYDYLKQGKIKQVPEDDSFKQFEMLIEQAKEYGFIHYEISNFALEGYYSKHNSSYWLGEKYLGIGPSAHSFDGVSRQWNVANNNEYISAIAQDKSYFEIEKLSDDDRFNDYIITSLRTIWGLSIKHIQEKFGDRYVKHVDSMVRKYAHSGDIIKEGDSIKLTTKGLFISDQLMMEFMAD